MIWFFVAFAVVGAVWMMTARNTTRRPRRGESYASDNLSTPYYDTGSYNDSSSSCDSGSSSDSGGGDCGGGGSD